MKYRFYWIDAFTTKAFGGNPCAVIFDADDLTDEQMLRIAKEVNLSETAFIMSSSQANYKARYFTPMEELPFAGHPTISVAHALIQERLIKPSSTMSLELKAGVIHLDLVVDSGLTKIVMTQRKPEFLAIHDKQVITSLFDLKIEDLLDSPVQTVSTGTPQLMIPVQSKDGLRRLKMDVTGYIDYRSKSDFSSAHLFCLEGATPVGTTFARHPGIPPHTHEDPFTGSSTGGMAAYLWKYQLIDKPTFIAEQGHWLGRPGSADVEILGPPTEILGIKVTGEAVTLVTGEIEI